MIFRYYFQSGNHSQREDGRGAKFEVNPVPIASHIIHLADRIAILVKDRVRIPDISAKVRDKIRGFSNRMFQPELVDAFDAVADSERF